MMATKTANVNSRMELEIKQQAEAILERLGIPRSVAIDMYYRQIIAHNGIPFRVAMPKEIPARDSMTDDEFNHMMAIGLQQAKDGETLTLEEAFAGLEG